MRGECIRGIYVRAIPRHPPKQGVRARPFTIALDIVPIS